ncbi:MAG: TetR/AcrR family transcriptional regulator [Actinobacteria bacterium]|nr:TetR/AcrR family transcriptional regulator [Actinomycetota bacterium]
MTQDERKQKSINKILGAAEQHLSEDGIEKMDIGKICRQAGLTKGAFYHHFGSKQQLLLELLDRWIKKISSEVNSAPFYSMEAPEIFNTIIDRMQPAFEKAGKQLPVFLELYVKAISDMNLRSYTLKSYESFLKFFSGIISEGTKKGSIKKSLDPDGTAKLLFAITIGLLIQGLLNPDGADWAVLAKESIRALFS